MARQFQWLSFISQGIPARNPAAAGFGEFRPLDAQTDEIAYRRNRRSNSTGPAPRLDPFRETGVKAPFRDQRIMRSLSDDRPRRVR